MVFTSKIAFNTSSFTVNVNEHPELLFLNGKRSKRKLLVYFLLRHTRAGFKKEYGNLKTALA